MSHRTRNNFLSEGEKMQRSYLTYCSDESLGNIIRGLLKACPNESTTISYGSTVFGDRRSQIFV